MFFRNKGLLREYQALFVLCLGFISHRWGGANAVHTCKSKCFFAPIIIVSSLRLLITALNVLEVDAFPNLSM